MTLNNSDADLQCEVCGRPIFGKPHRVIIERAKMTTCSKCSELGSGEWEPVPVSRGFPTIKGNVATAKTAFIRKRETITISEDIAVADGFGSLVRRAREKMGLSHEDLGRKVAEKVSIIKKIESEKMAPDQRVAEKLEHALGIKLIVPLVVPKVSLPSVSTSKTVTLGEIVKLKEAKKRSR
jgi:putative transcription factor